MAFSKVLVLLIVALFVGSSVARCPIMVSVDTSTSPCSTVDPPAPHPTAGGAFPPGYFPSVIEPPLLSPAPAPVTTAAAPAPSPATYAPAPATNAPAPSPATYAPAPASAPVTNAAAPASTPATNNTSVPVTNAAAFISVACSSVVVAVLASALIIA